MKFSICKYAKNILEISEKRILVNEKYCKITDKLS